MRPCRPKLGAFAALFATLFAFVPVILLSGCRQRKSIILTGSVIREDEDPSKQSPIADAVITVSKGMGVAPAKSDGNGFFKITLQPQVLVGQPVVLEFRRTDYEPLDATDIAGDQLYVARMVPLPHPPPPVSNQPETTIANLRIRYSEKTTNTVEVGTVVKTLQIVNSGNVPCNGRAPCSPDGKWKASINFVNLDAGEGNEFRNARVSCIAGPCSFTKIEHDGFSKGGRNISVSVRDWSDTATYLIEADVVHPATSDQVRYGYPVILGQALNFSLPSGAEGPSVEADVNGDSIVFPLGPELCLAWADCAETVDRSKAKTYRCQLKPGYRLK
jgi:hypothetical protein